MIILASTSPTRRALLDNAGLTYSAVSPQVDERDLVARHADWSPEETAMKLAEAKAIEVSTRFPDAVVIGADQVLALGHKAYAKPASVEECRRHLLELRGKTHALISAVVCARAGATVWSHSSQALLTMREFSPAFLEQYLERLGADCMTSVGGYKIEGPGLQLFEKVDGDHFTILGLPLFPLLSYLRNAGEVVS
jgi:septum formation protein